MQPLGGEPGVPHELLQHHVPALVVVGGSLRDRRVEGQVEQVHLQHHLVGDARQRRSRERAEVDVGDERAGVVGGAVGGVSGALDRVELEGGGAGAGVDGEQRCRLGGRGAGVDDDGPGAVRGAVGRRARRTVHGPHLRVRVGGHGGGVEGGVLDVVAHAAHVVLAHRLDVEQRAAVVEVELAVGLVVHGVAEVHELGGSADLELHPLEDRGDAGALEAEGALHAAGVDRAGRRPLLDGDLGHAGGAERADAVRHPGAVDEVPGEQQLGHEHGELLAGQLGVATRHRTSARTRST